MERALGGLSFINQGDGLDFREKRWPCIIGAILLVCLTCSPAWAGKPKGKPRFVDFTVQAGLSRTSVTFSAVFSDIDGDGDDDLIVGNHGTPPSLFINRDGVFADASDLIPIPGVADRHGIVAVDLDNDGDRDLVIAGGGADGIGTGASNEVYRNLLRETGELGFEDVSATASLAHSTWRGRAFIPVASADGTMVNLYFTTKPREGTTNLLFRNMGNMVFEADSTSRLNRSFNSEGKDVFFDFDRDGDQDLLLINDGKITLFENRDGRYRRVSSALSDYNRVRSVAVGDLDNDGYPDIFVGRGAPLAYSDNVNGDAGRINIRVINNGAGDRERICFAVQGDSIRINFFVKRGLGDTSTDDIYIGGGLRHPVSREADIVSEDASGRPSISAAGTYIWYDQGEGKWWIEWKHPADSREFRGEIYATGIGPLGRELFEFTESRRNEDLIFSNRGGRVFERCGKESFEHDLATRSTAVVDVDNDGLNDIVGIRGSEAGRLNGNLFFIMNMGEGGYRFVDAGGLSQPDARLAQADMLIYGFADGDGYPDMFITNGWGLVPGNSGPYQLLLNRSKGNNYLIVELVGTRSNRDAIGAQVEVRTRKGELLGYRELGVDYNRAQCTHKLHFGLGRYSGRLRLTVRWPDGTVQQVKTKVNRIRVVRESSS